MLLAQRAPRPSVRPRLPAQLRLFFVAVGLLVAGETIFWTMLAAVQSNSGAAALDGPVHDGIVASRIPFATAILTAVTTVTSPLWMTVLGCALALVWAAWKREVWRPALLLGAMAATFAVSTLIKHGENRGRPAASDFMLGPDAGGRLEPPVPGSSLADGRARRHGLVHFAGQAAVRIEPQLGGAATEQYWRCRPG
jgi:undecaprenyl-diphosphatase